MSEDTAHTPKVTAKATAATAAHVPVAKARAEKRKSHSSLKRKRHSKTMSSSGKTNPAHFPLSTPVASTAAKPRFMPSTKMKDEDDSDDDELDEDDSCGSSEDSEDDAEEKKQRRNDARRKLRRGVHEAFLFGEKNMLPSDYERKYYLSERTFPRPPLVAKDKEPLYRAVINYDPIEKIQELMKDMKAESPDKEMDDGKKKKRTGTGVTLLHAAAMCGRSDVVSLLVVDGSELEARDMYDNTPLHYAVYFNEPESTLALLNSALKFKRNIVNRRNEAGMTALYIAAAGGFTSICRILKKFDAQMTSTGPNGRYPLHEAVLSLNLNCVEQLLEDGADPNMCDSQLRTPLHYASLLPKERRDIMAAVMKPMTSFDAKDKDKMTALEYAVMHGYDSCISLFTVVKNGSNVCTVYDIRARMEKHCAPPLPDPPALVFIPFTRINSIDARTGRTKPLSGSFNRPKSNSLSRTQSRLAVLTPPPRAKNRYGFCTLNALNKAEELTQKEKDEEEALAVKWAKLLPEWDKQKRSAIEKLCIGGVPEALRGEIWKRLCGVPEAMRKQPDEYKTLRGTVAQRRIAVLIDADIQRCHLDHSLFAVPYSGGQISLFNVMKAYSLYDAAVGYTQGMTDLAGLFLMYMSEEDTFWLLVQLMFDTRWEMHGLFTDGFPLVAACCHVQAMLVGKFFPDLAKHMHDIGFDPAVINGAAMEWYMALFSRIVPFSHVVRIFDVVFCRGYSSVFQFAMAFFQLLRPKLLQIRDPNVFVESLKAIPAVIGDMKPNDIVQLAMKYKTAPSLAERYSAEFRRKHSTSSETPPTSPSTNDPEDRDFA